MKRTVLDLTQSILSSMNASEVNSISDTTESLQVADILKTTYFNMLSRIHPSVQKQLVTLDPSLDPTMPVMMFVPAGVSKIEWIKYFDSSISSPPNNFPTHGINTNIVPTTLWTTTSVTSNTIGTGSKTFTVSANLPVVISQQVSIVSGVNTMTGYVLSYVGTTLIVNVLSFTGSGTFTSWTISAISIPASPHGYQYVTILPVSQFIDMVTQFNPSQSIVNSFTFTDNKNNFPGTYKFYYKNNKQPQFCTIINDYYVIFDSYDNTQDSTLEASKVMGYGEIIPTWVNSDSFIPNLDETTFPLLLNEAKSLAFFELKQMPHSKAEQEAKRGWTSVQKDKDVVTRPTAFDALPNFGRTRGSMNTGNWSAWRGR